MVVQSPHAALNVSLLRDQAYWRGLTLTAGLSDFRADAHHLNGAYPKAQRAECVQTDVQSCDLMTFTLGARRFADSIFL